jgi:hypothetical protein
MVVGSDKNIEIIGDIAITINDSPLQRVNSIKTLGVMIDSKLNFIQQANKVARNCNFTLSKLYPIKNMLSFESRLLLANAMIVSKLRYAAVVWSDSNKKVVSINNKVLRTVARFVLGKRKYDNVSDDINYVLEWLSCMYYYNFEVLKTCFQIVNSTCPDHFVNHIITEDPIIVNTRNNQYFIPNIKKNTLWGESSFRFKASKLWLNIPIEIQQEKCLITFKRMLYAYLLTLQIKNTIHIYDDDNCNDVD